MILPKFSNIILLDTIGSTNSYVKEHANELSEGTALFTREQTAGRGRYNRRWEGCKDKSIFLSLLLKNIDNPYTGVRLTFAFSLAIGKFLEKYIDKNIIQYKWPNDILINNKKICGILCEFSGASLVIGIGVNVYNFDHSDEIDRLISYMEDFSKKLPSIEIIREEVIENINNMIDEISELEDENLPKYWFENSKILDSDVKITDDDGTCIVGKVKGIENNGALLLDVNGLIKKIVTGDMFYND
ncbi:MAG: biotin--[acetyl-CoA-carboxylase] ligase [Candidatus Delongbacteria bacterium]|nr:biotin--[acetyl-CoA-carboxylase] ligase [Candidatus Delongbacteria bacterium]MBN2834426.1 biotin--[acetyl-CoA-carboxylase] ligase [Candidatus Delongbacteria bacterium]